jgi:ComF family protein
MRNFLRNILDVIFPIQCLGCKTEGAWLCEKCLRAIPLKETDHCPQCKQASSGGAYCEHCRERSLLAGIAVAADYHNSTVAQAIKTLKYRFIPDVGTQLSRLLVWRVQDLARRARQADWLGVAGETPFSFFTDFSNKVIIPVPLHPRRLRWRGFNQAAQLAHGFAKGLELNCNDVDLRRVRYTTSQAQLHADERKKNLENSFVWRGGDLAGRNILLIDDVATTGATLQACGQALKIAGAGRIWGLVVAQN